MHPRYFTSYFWHLILHHGAVSYSVLLLIFYYVSKSRIWLRTQKSTYNRPSTHFPFSSSSTLSPLRKTRHFLSQPQIAFRLLWLEKVISRNCICGIEVHVTASFTSHHLVHSQFCINSQFLCWMEITHRLPAAFLRFLPLHTYIVSVSILIFAISTTVHVGLPCPLLLNYVLRPGREKYFFSPHILLGKWSDYAKDVVEFLLNFQTASPRPTQGKPTTFPIHSCSTTQSAG